MKRQVQYARNDYFLGENFHSLKEARVEAERWSREEAGERTHGRTGKKPAEAFIELEKEHLLEAPKEHYDPPEWTTKKVGRDHCVQIAYAIYSVPFQHGECKVNICWDRSTVKIYKKGELIKTHPRQNRGGESIIADDLPPHVAILATRDSASLVGQAEALGMSIGEYARGLTNSPLPWTKMRHLYRLLSLAETYGAAKTNEACARALAVDVVDVNRISRMLEKGLRKKHAQKLKPTRKANKDLQFARPTACFFTSGGPIANA